MTHRTIPFHLSETLASLTITDRMLEAALQPANIAHLSEQEIESLWTALRAVGRFEKPLRLASERIEQKAFEADIEWLSTDHG